LRLRQDESSHLTFKSGGRETEGVVTRREIEVRIDDFTAGQRILEALGFEVVFIYEKFRTLFTFGETQVMLDELPYGNFIEIEGPQEEIHGLAKSLHLDWGKAIPISYYLLFENLPADLGFDFRDVTFANFAGRKVGPEDLGVRPAD
jgi:adenylate cyclase class 2